MTKIIHWTQDSLSGCTQFGSLPVHVLFLDANGGPFLKLDSSVALKLSGPHPLQCSFDGLTPCQKIAKGTRITVTFEQD